MPGSHRIPKLHIALLQALRPLLERIQVDLSAGRRSATELSPSVRRVYTVLEDCRAVVNEWCEGGAGAGAVSCLGITLYGSCCLLQPCLYNYYKAEIQSLLAATAAVGLQLRPDSQHLLCGMRCASPSNCESPSLLFLQTLLRMWMSRDVEAQLIELERRLSDCVIDISAALNLSRWDRPAADDVAEQKQ